MTEPDPDPMFDWLVDATNAEYRGQQRFDAELRQLGVEVDDEHH